MISAAHFIHRAVRKNKSESLGRLRLHQQLWITELFVQLTIDWFIDQTSPSRCSSQTAPAGPEQQRIWQVELESFGGRRRSAERLCAGRARVGERREARPRGLSRWDPVCPGSVGRRCSWWTRGQERRLSGRRALLRVPVSPGYLHAALQAHAPASIRKQRRPPCRPARRTELHRSPACGRAPARGNTKQRD